MHKKYKSLLVNFSLILASVFLCLIILEIVLRVERYVSRSDAESSFLAGSKGRLTSEKDNEWKFFEYDSVLGWRNKALEKGIFNIKETVSYVKINSKGLRDVEHRYKKDSAFRILLLGNSFTWGFGVESNQRFSFILQKLLGNKYECINTGVSGYGTDQEYLYYTIEGYKYKADLVILAFGMEDLRNNTHSVQYSYPKPYFINKGNKLYLKNIPVPRKKLKWEERFGISQDLYAVRPENSGPVENESAAEKLNKFLGKYFISYGFLRNKIKALQNPTDNIDPVTAALFFKLKRFAADNGTKFAVVMIPYKYHVLKNSDRERWETYRRFFVKNGFNLIDLKPGILKETRNNQKLYFDRDEHWNPRGHMLAASIIYKYLVEHNLVTKVPSYTHSKLKSNIPR